MNDFRADLHCHSTCSDGTESPKQLIDLALINGLKGLSITDHDTINAYEIARPYALEKGLKLLNGVEFSTVFQNHSIHILGYAFNLKSQSILRLCQRHAERRALRNIAILEKLKERNMIISEEEMLSSVPKDDLTTRLSVGRPHIAQAMVLKGYVSSVQDAFNLYLADNKPCYVRGNSITTEESIDAIHQAGGVAIIAHPHIVNNRKLLNKLIELKFDGIECYYGRFLKKDEVVWLNVAKRKNWLITGGSDFHGTIKPTIPLGCSWVNEEIFRELYQRQEKNESL